jgi:diaminohydroxyphosphoribosylaminopyrimidine deaminase / 5-amino-6-(5-phosphoribosylamino)uracil reductase
MREDEGWMARALELAARAEGETNPNPVVGCVVVKGGRLLGEGYHRRAGGPHAEAYALRQAGPAAAGATLYVTLEPCTIVGRTPPCAPSVAASGIRRVVAAMKDPNPRVDGRGLALLRRAGVQVSVGVREQEARRLNERFAVAVRLEDRPFVLLKAALTLDGRIATAGGDSKWVTSAEQRRAARRLRRLHDGVAVGIETVLKDDPLLLPAPRVRRPFHRVVFDSRLRLPSTSRLVRTCGDGPLIVVSGAAPEARRRRLEAHGVTVLQQDARSGRPSLRWALRALRGHGLWTLMVEGGGELLGSFLAERLFDQVALFRAPLLLGGRGSRPAFGGPDPSTLRGAARLRPAGDADSASPFELWYPR